MSVKVKKIIALLAAIALLIVLGMYIIVALVGAAEMSFYIESIQYNDGYCYMCGRKYKVHKGSGFIGDFYECPNCKFIMNY